MTRATIQIEAESTAVLVVEKDGMRHVFVYGGDEESLGDLKLMARAYDVEPRVLDNRPEAAKRRCLIRRRMAMAGFSTDTKGWTEDELLELERSLYN